MRKELPQGRQVPKELKERQVLKELKELRQEPKVLKGP